MDDVATSMATKFELLEKIESETRLKDISYHINGIGIGLDREQTTALYDSAGQVMLGQKGANAIQDFVSRSGIPVFAVTGIGEVVEYLYKEGVPVMIRGNHRPMDEKTKTDFDEYVELYGVK